MQTFLPFKSFTRSVQVLDRLRLGKMRCEAWQILQAIKNPDYGWQNHPAVKMWRRYETALALYGLHCCLEWKRRGYADGMAERFKALIPLDNMAAIVMPHWLGREDFHRSHQSNLVRKNPWHYRQFIKEDVPDDVPYVWPV